MDTEFWNKTSDYYEKNIADHTTRIMHSFINIPKYEQCNRILETGCGPGNGISLILSRAKPDAQLVCIDISETHIAKALSKNYQRTECKVGNAENLEFANDEFDLYISNMCLNLVANYTNMLREAFRVTKPGSYSLFTIWGNHIPNSSSTLLYQVLEKYGPVPINGFLLSDDAFLKQEVKNVGFSSVFTFYSAVPMPFHTVDEAMEFYEQFRLLDPYRSLPEYPEIISEIRAKVAEQMENGNSIVFTYLTCAAVK